MATVMATAMATDPRRRVSIAGVARLKVVRQLIIWPLAAAVAFVAATTAIGAVAKHKAPQWALDVWPVNAFAYAELADDALKASIVASEGKMPEKIDGQITAWGRQAVEAEPTSVVGARTLALAAQAKGEDAQARRLMRLAQRINKRDLIANLWLIEDYSRAGEFEQALSIYDQALRSLAPERRGLLLTAMVGALSNEALISPYHQLLRGSPPWAPEFWRQAAQTAPALDNAALLRLRLAREGVELPLENEVLLLNGLIGQQRFAAAHQLYATLSAVDGEDAALVRNGDFSEAPRLPPFDWTLLSSGEMGAGVNGQSGQLEISAIGGSGGLVAEQLIRLDPGRYRLAARFAGSAPSGPLPLHAELTCAQAAQAQPRKVDMKWNAGSEPITVAGSSCSFYWLRLLVDAREREEGFELALDSLSLEKL